MGKRSAALRSPLRDAQQEDPVGVCPICKTEVWPDDPAVKTECGIAHADCTEPEEPESLAFAKQLKEESK